MLFDYALPFFCAFGCGILTAWGVGGGTLLLLVMTLVLGLDQQMAQGINLLFFLPSAAMGLYRHHRQGYLHVPTLQTALPWGVAGAILGAWLATSVDVALLRRPFGVYLWIAGMMLLFGKDKQETPNG